MYRKDHLAAPTTFFPLLTNKICIKHMYVYYMLYVCTYVCLNTFVLLCFFFVSFLSHCVLKSVEIRYNSKLNRKTFLYTYILMYTDMHEVRLYLSMSTLLKNFVLQASSFASSVRQRVSGYGKNMHARATYLQTCLIYNTYIHRYIYMYICIYGTPVLTIALMRTNTPTHLADKFRKPQL